MEHTLTVKTVTVSYNAPRPLRPCVDAPEIARRVVLSEMRKRDTDTENIFVLTQNARHVMTGFKHLHTGSGTQSVVDVRKLFETILKCGATGFILAHNHPSGDLSPSADDLGLTRRVLIGAAILGLNFHDHIITVPDGHTVSIRAIRPDVFETPSSKETETP